MNRSTVAFLGLVALATGAVTAQNRPVVTTADYDRAVKMLAPALNNLVFGRSEILPTLLRIDVVNNNRKALMSYIN